MAALEGVAVRLAAIKRAEKEVGNLNAIIQPMKRYTDDNNSDMLEQSMLSSIKNPSNSQK